MTDLGQLSSMPLGLIYKPFFHGPLLKVLYKIPIPATCSATTSPSCTGSSAIRMTIGWRWIVCWAGLKPNWCVGIKMARDSLDRRGNSTLLLIHCGSALSASSCCSLSIEVLLWGVLPNWDLSRNLMHNTNLVAIGSRL